MPEKIYYDKLKNEIAKRIHEMGYDNLVGGKLDEIVRTVMERVKGGQIPPEGKQEITEENMPNPIGVQMDFPQEPQPSQKRVVPTINTQEQQATNNVPAGARQMDVPYEPKTGYVPEMPDFIKNVEPGKLIIFDQNELSEAPEKLTYKLFRTFENPDEKNSLYNMWTKEAKQNADVYLVKLEKIGQLSFDYKSGISKFIEMRMQPDTTFAYKQAPPISQTVMQQQTIPILNPNGTVVKESEEIKLIDLVAVDTKYKKISTPGEVLKALSGDKNAKASIISENKEIRTFEFDGEKYFIPVNPITERKCYTLK